MFVVRRFPEPNYAAPCRSKSSCRPSIQLAEALMTSSPEEKEITLSFDVPGVKRENVSVEEKDGVLGVRAERKSADKVVARLNKAYKLDGRLVDVESIRAELADGVLTVVLPKNKDTKQEPTTVTVTPGYPDLNQDKEQPKQDSAESVKDEGTDKAQFHIAIDLPGVRLEDLEVKLVDVYGTDTSHVNVRATRKKGNFVSEIHRQYSVPVNRFDTSKLQAFLADGVLTILAPPRVTNGDLTTVPRKIPVEAPSPLALEATTTNDAMDTTESPKDDEDDAVIVETIEEP